MALLMLSERVNVGTGLVAQITGDLHVAHVLRLYVLPTVRCGKRRGNTATAKALLPHKESNKGRKKNKFLDATVSIFFTHEPDFHTVLATVSMLLFALEKKTCHSYCLTFIIIKINSTFKPEL